MHAHPLHIEPNDSLDLSSLIPSLQSYHRLTLQEYLFLSFITLSQLPCSYFLFPSSAAILTSIALALLLDTLLFFLQHSALSFNARVIRKLHKY